MAITAAPICIDLVNGSDAAIAALTPTAYANNGSGQVRVTVPSTATLTTNGYVNISGTSSLVYSGVWLITVINATTFDLQTSTFTVNPASKGTVQPYRGATWNDSIKTFSYSNTLTGLLQSPATSLDYKIAKSSEPTSIGNATWTSKSATVTLATAKTLNIDNCDTAWTAVAGSDVTITNATTYRKEGTNALTITFDAAVQTNIKQCYKTLAAATDYSSYDSISFWFRSTTAVPANSLRLVLCSDTTGTTVVDEFIIPAATLTANLAALDLTRTGGGALGNNIQSIALYTMGTVTNSQVLSLDNIFACNANSLSLNTLISKSSTLDFNGEYWWAIKSISGTTVVLDQDTTNNEITLSNTFRGYYTTGTSPETVTTYIQKPIQIPLNRTLTLGNNGNYIFVTGNYGGTKPHTVKFGYDTSTDTQTSTTWINTLTNISFYECAYNQNITVSNLGVMRAASSITFSLASGGGSSYIQTISNIYSSGCQSGVVNSTATSATTLNNIYSAQLRNGLGFNGAYTGLININNVRIISSSQMSSTGNPISVFNSLDGLYVWNSYGGGITSYFGLVSAPQNTAVWYNIDIRDNTGNVFNCVGAQNNTNYTFPQRIVNLTAYNNDNLFYGRSGMPIQDVYVTNMTSSGNTNIVTGEGPVIIFINPSIAEAFSKLSQDTTYLNPFFSRYNKVLGYGGNTDDNRYIGFNGNYAIQQSTTTYTGSGLAWQTNITSSSYNSSTATPFRLPIARIAFNAGTAVTFKAFVKMSAASGINTRLFIPANPFLGITNDLTANKTADTNWEALQISFTPTKKGVIDVYQDTWYVSSTTQSSYVDSITVTQA